MTNVQDELRFAQEQRLKYTDLVRDLERQVYKEYLDTLDLPRKPGWYLTKDGQIGLLTDTGQWEDGWGNDWESGDSLESMVGAVRLVPETKEEA
jgi:hypothetical protein